METKLCSRCKAEKPHAEFYWYAKQNAFSAQCKACATERAKERYAADPNARERGRAQYYKHHEKRLAYCAEYRAKPENHERILQYHRIPEHRTIGLERAKEWAKANPERSADNKRKFNYGVPYGWYAKTLAEQDGKCAICETSIPGNRKDMRRDSFTIDHDHETGQVRGLLCNNCNFLIGHAKEKPEILEDAAKYMRYYKPHNTKQT